MNIEKQKRFIINFFYFVILFGLSILIVRYALPALFPFVIALLVTLLLRPLVRLCVEKLHFNSKAASALFVVLFYGTIGLLVVLLVIKLIGYIGILIARLPDFFNQTVTPALKVAASMVSEIIENFNSQGTTDIDETAANVISSLSTAISDFSGKVLAFVGSYATSVPSILLNIVITIISTAFMLMDYDSIKAFIVRQLPDEKRRFIASVAEHLGKVIWKYLTSYLIIMLITFAELSLGLFCVGEKNPFGLAAGIAVFDILPVVGSGTVLVPWAVISMLTGNVGRGVGLIIVWVIISIIRQIIEPKIVGDTVGMHPLLTIFAMLFGNFVYGGLGIFLVPITIALCQNLQEHGIIHLYKTAPAEERTADAGETGGIAGRLRGLIVRLGGKKNKTDKNGKNGDDGNAS